MLKKTGMLIFGCICIGVVIGLAIAMSADLVNGNYKDNRILTKSACDSAIKRAIEIHGNTIYEEVKENCVSYFCKDGCEGKEAEQRLVCDMILLDWENGNG